tara:strand:- start:52883 stop:53638 length:756 start_codon:yes stop_codon:yes gene_type:complete
MKKIIVVSLLLFISLLSAKSMAISITTYRLLINNTQPEADFYVFSNEIYDQACNITLRDYVFDKNGNSKEHKGSERPDISAKKLLRYSPRRFELKAGASQKVHFKYRRKKSKIPTEYRSYLSLDCKQLNEKRESKAQTDIKPNLRHNIPIIVRTGNIEVDIKFSEINVTNNIISFSLNKSGKRSVYGDVVLINNQNNEEIHRKRAVSLPVEVDKMSIILPLLKLSPNLIDIQFIEDKKLSGDANVKVSVIN